MSQVNLDVVMTYKVNEKGKTCSNTGTVGLSPDHYLMVQINTTSSATTWRLGFRL